MAGHIFQHIQDFILGVFRPRLLPTGSDTSESVPAAAVTWADATVMTWADGTVITWSNS